MGRARDEIEGRGKRETRPEGPSAAQGHPCGQGPGPRVYLSPVWDKLANTIQPLASFHARPQTAAPLGTRGRSQADPFPVSGCPALCAYPEPTPNRGQLPDLGAEREVFGRPFFPEPPHPLAGDRRCVHTEFLPSHTCSRSLPSLPRCGSRTAGPKSAGCRDHRAGRKALQPSTLCPRNREPAPLSPRLRLRNLPSGRALCSLPVPCSLRTAPGKSCQQQMPAPPATAGPAGTQPKASGTWSRLHLPLPLPLPLHLLPLPLQIQLQPRPQSGLWSRMMKTTPKPPGMPPQSLISQSCSLPWRTWRSPSPPPDPGMYDLVGDSDVELFQLPGLQWLPSPPSPADAAAP